MKLSMATLSAFVAMHRTVDAFAPKIVSSPGAKVLLNMGYLDDLSPIPNPNIEEEVDDSFEATKMKAEDIDRAGPGSWESYVEFNEFDGGDGQMGVAGDGNVKLDKFDMSEMAKSKTMSAKNAWGKSTGYAESLVEKGVDTARAQQLENWHNQQELLQQRKQQRFMTDEFDQTSSSDDDWRKLASFGIQRNQDFDLNETFGAVAASTEIEGTIELVGRMNGPYATHEFSLRNPFMGFADFRAAFTAETPSEFTVEPKEGSLRQKEDTNFLVKFKAQKPGVVEGYLVIETEDFKKTWKVVGSTN
ncbi:hypothetical protein IV203_034754 [Nitzschia inconspicua]|uniref:Uncharacterized protein n=1 Tax=Nitzschia inconspicua TaxID=303405 RepID=A0A9K3P8E9_9STRA|nr:hypothetical protein IV203_000010 [Nitzschia inconspicua]KAG7359656.1 hypothetical protein IV203_034754 [Nitzschia inconspicua]